MPATARKSPVASDALKARARLVHERLCAEYGCPIPFFHDLDPLSELVSSLLSHRTRNADSGRAFKSLRARFPDWPSVRDAPTSEVQSAVSPCTWPEQKAPRIQAVLKRDHRADEANCRSISWPGCPPREARDWLESIPEASARRPARRCSCSVA